MLKTLLKCPNNFVSSNFLKEKIPASADVKSLALRSGYLEFDLFERGYNISIFSNRYFIYEFWKCLINSPDTLHGAIKFYHDNLNHTDIAIYKDKWYEHFEDPYDRSAVYYLLNRYSNNGNINGTNLAKRNFSKLTLMSFEKSAIKAKNLNLFFLPEESIIKTLENFSNDSVVFLPIGKFKRKFILDNNLISIDSVNYDNEKLKECLKGNKKMVLVYKYDKFVDEYYDDKTYINKLGFVTENPELAEDLIVSNF